MKVFVMKIENFWFLPKTALRQFAPFARCFPCIHLEPSLDPKARETPLFFGKIHGDILLTAFFEEFFWGGRDLFFYMMTTTPTRFFVKKTSVSVLFWTKIQVFFFCWSWGFGSFWSCALLSFGWEKFHDCFSSCVFTQMRQISKSNATVSGVSLHRVFRFRFNVFSLIAASVMEPNR